MRRESNSDASALRLVKDREHEAAKSALLAPGRIEVTYLDGDTFNITTRGHGLVVDQPHAAGGDDLGPTPTELFVASLASCVGHYAGRYLYRHGIPRAGLRVTAEFAMADDRPARVGAVKLRVSVPADLTEQQRKALKAVVDHCTVHNTLRRPPLIETRIG